jgi:hypothetical protein
MIICCLDSFILGRIPLLGASELLLLMALLLPTGVLLFFGFLFFETGTELLQPFK